MDYFTICAQRLRLDKIFVGKKVETIRIFKKYAIFIGFEGNSALKLSGTPGMPYVHTVEKRYIPVRNAHDWHLSKFSGTVLEDIEIKPGDRILTFIFNTGFRLIFEMTGRYSNIIAVNPDGIVEGAARVITRSKSGFREIRPGVEYSPPPARDSFDLVWGAPPVLEERLNAHDADLDEALAISLCAGSRFFAREAAAISGLDPERNPSDLSRDDTFDLLKAAALLADRIEKGGEGGTILIGGDGLPVDVFPLPMKTAGESDTYFSDLDEAVIRYARDREYGLEFRQLKQTIGAVIKREEKRIRSTIKKVERERGDESEPELLDRKGNTILANLHKITKGMDTVILPDPYGTGETEIELDPVLDGPGNVERLFARARKIRAASKHAVGRIAGLLKRLENLDAESKRIDSMDDIKELRKIAGKYARMSAPGIAPDADRQFPRRFTSPSGLEIIVGRSDKENDELIRWAHKNDIWLHAQSIGGSHVILRSPGKQNPDHRSLEFAAAITAHYSKGKASAVVPVVWTRVKYVVKRKGQGPGQVHYTREKVLFVEPGLPGNDT